MSKIVIVPRSEHSCARAPRLGRKAAAPAWVIYAYDAYHGTTVALALTTYCTAVRHSYSAPLQPSAPLNLLFVAFNCYSRYIVKQLGVYAMTQRVA